nr:FAD-dependent oxidoreductase [Bdellovibrio sp. CKG001]BFD63769.1 FAD-dependent oxidoreductase [Bdellovibrio sp. HM001]
MNSLYDAVIIGAGMAGLTLASRLKSLNKTFVILEKSAGVGGRLATRRGEDCAFDHGAQFIRVKTKDPMVWPDLPQIQEIGKVWFNSEAMDHIAFPKGMTQLPKALNFPEQLRLKEKVIRIQKQNQTCCVETDNGQIYECKELYITSPLPQSLALLQDSGISYPAELNDIQYASALVGLFRVQSSDKNILQIRHLNEVTKEIFSVSNQLSKQVSQNLAFTVVMQPEWSRQRFNQEDTMSLQEISTSFAEILNQMAPSDSFTLVNSQLKKWRYSHPLAVFESPFVSLSTGPRIVLLGDAFGGGSIQGAIRSAYAVPFLT